MEEFKIKSSQVSKEGDAEKILVNFLREYFPKSDIDSQHKLGGYIGHIIDVDIDKRYGIELKLANSLYKSAANIQRLIGQLFYYKKTYGDNLFLFIIGPKELQKEPMIKELMNLVEEDLGIELYYIKFSGNKKK